MDIKKEFERWLVNATADADVAAELKMLDDTKIEDAFYRDLAFGTGGLRGVIGAGTNRMNVYTVAKASQGLADYLKKNFETPSVTIGYDSRIKSDVFAKIAAGVFAANGVKVNIWPVLMPVPTVSFATRYLHTSAGVMVTASHNPSKYNGYKVYGADGCQITTEAAAEILAEIEKLDIFADVKTSDFEADVANGSIQYIPDEVYTAFVAQVKSQSVLFGEEVNKDVAIVYSPLNGTGLKPVTRTLKEMGYTNITVVKEQERPDGNFPTCPYPNPEIKEAMALGIILLSGGSGKRLWPLSNDVRSKQFIKLFKDGNKYESMVQRVYRQITTVDSNAKITIATSKSQASAIKNQLGEKASICVEPCRRDTFPAIALAAAYLHDELNVGTDEAVVVCPVDPYVDNTYYEAVKTLQELAAQGGANLTLMGIEPTYPSEKYGYIIPESGDNVSKVKEFKEKPDVETAKKYLAQSALWNAGIFAFKLGYLLDKAHSMIDFEDYRDLFNKYDTLTKISFDYAVVEKEASIQVLRYSGDWKDVGTWNMMAEVMADKTKGKAILDETCENTNVVNELNIPILCMGCKDMIVAASGDGILISDKERSGYMKPYVEKIETEAMYAEKSWGTYTVIDVQPGSMTVKISMKAGEKMSYHMHNEREEVWTVVSGKGKAIVDGMEQVLRTGDVITIAAGCKHTVEAITPLDMIEVQLGDEISVSDKIKFELD